ncbi:MAG: sigma-54-dependent Fis family transcriptional regulator [Candidatus Delongbacteria bacterium]|nr:sigma-54-dependent Fis family transcriptional regulator [Candidatus Delongbacteria bacterium]MBN2836459.1 sigma-54-dependent Fis family transcriptional regulator [Candidatus Delongbacteria bacterium]
MKIFLIDDDDQSRLAIENFLKFEEKIELSVFNSCDNAMSKYHSVKPEIIISDIRMTGMTGLDLLKKVKESEQGDETDVILITGFGDLNSCVTALREGAFDYLIKPINVEELITVIERSEEKRELHKENQSLKREKEILSSKIISTKNNLVDFINLIGNEEYFNTTSKSMSKAYDFALKLHENSDIPCLITGESGTGKEVMARFIHHGTNGSEKPFISINCAAVSSSLFESEIFGYDQGAFTGADSKGKKGKLELADGGTLFLDEIGDMPIEMQPKLLRVLQEKNFYKVGGVVPVSVNVRIVCATNHDIEKKIEEKLFRPELFYRLNTGHIELSPLRKRKEEIIPLAENFLKKSSLLRKKKFEGFSSDAVDFLLSYEWPGNIRELKNIIERIVLLFDDNIVRLSHLSPYLHSSTKNYASVNNELIIRFDENGPKFSEIEYMVTKKALEITDGNINKAARLLDVSWATLVKRGKLKE